MLTYRNVYNWIKEYKDKYCIVSGVKEIMLVEIPKISWDKNKQMIKEIISKSPRICQYLKNTWSIRLFSSILFTITILPMNVSPIQTWTITFMTLVSYLRDQNLHLNMLKIIRKRKKI